MCYIFLTESFFLDPCKGSMPEFIDLTGDDDDEVTTPPSNDTPFENPPDVISLMEEDDHLLVFPEGCSEQCACARCKNVRDRLIRKEQDEAVQRAIEEENRQKAEEEAAAKKRKRDEEEDARYQKKIKPTDPAALRAMRLRGLERYKAQIRLEEEKTGERNKVGRRRFNLLRFLA